MSPTSVPPARAGQSWYVPYFSLIYVNAGTELAGVYSAGDLLSPGLIASLALLGAFPLLARKVLALIRGRLHRG